MNWLPYINKARVQIRGRKSMEEAAVSMEVLEEESFGECRPTIHLESERAKFQSAQPETSMEKEIARMVGRKSVHKPVIRYQFENALVFKNGFSVAGGTFSRFGELPHKDLLMGPCIRLDRALFAAAPPSMRYFGHWLTEACTTALLKEEDESLILPRRSDWPHTEYYSDLFHLPFEDGDVFKVKQLTWIADTSQGPSRRARYAELRKRAKANIGTNSIKSDLVYLRRGNSGMERSFDNEAALIVALQKQGFSIIEVDGVSAQEIHQQIDGASVVMSVEGSHQSHSLFSLRDGGVLFSIVPSDRVANVNRDRTNAMGLEYAMVVAELRDGKCLVDIEAVFETLKNCANADIDRSLFAAS